MNTINPGVTGRKNSIAVPGKGAETSPGQSDPVATWLKSFGVLAPFAVPIDVAQTLLGRKSRSQIYEAIGKGELDAVKDGGKTLVVVSSIVRYCERMKPAQIKPPAPRKKPWPHRSPKSATAKRLKVCGGQIGPEAEANSSSL